MYAGAVVRRSDWLAALAVVGGTLAGAGCDDASSDADGPAACAEDLPPGWEYASQSMVLDTEADCSGASAEADATLALAVVDGELELTAAGLLFRSAQDVCAYHRVVEAGAEVLFQPCEMRPALVEKGDCLYTLRVRVPDAPTLEVFRRGDLFGDEPVEAEVVGVGGVDAPR